MIKKKLIAIMTSAFCIAAVIPAVPAMADGQKVVTLGADLSAEQQTMMLEYFGVYGEGVETLYINNAEEREHLAAYVPIEQIGTRTVSCAMVNPTTSGGIQVKTANLTWVTGYMIASTLSTSGVVNCEVLAAAPFPVSGTGALTGIMMAYEAASGETLDEAKKDAATQELVTTATIAGDIGQETAVQIVNETKIEVIEGNAASTEEIQGIVEDAVQNMEVSLSQEDRDLLVGLLDTLSGLDYEDEEVDAMKDNLDRVEQAGGQEDASDVDITGNDEDIDNASGTDDASAADSSSDSESIFNKVDDSALGDDVEFSSTYEEDENSETEANPDEDAGNGEDQGVTEPDEDAGNGEDQGVTEPDENAGNEEGQGVNEPDETAEGDIPADETEVLTVSELNLIPNANNGETDLMDPENGPEKAVPGLTCLTIQSSVTDLAAGSGSISIYKAENDAENDMLIETISMEDEKQVVSEEITDMEALKDLGWDEGIEFRIYLSEPLEPDSSYYVVLSDDAFTAEDGTISFMASDNVDDWTFETAAYGISVEETVDGIKTGVLAVVNLYMDPEADYAVVECILPDGSVAEEGDYAADSTFEVTFDQPGETTVKVSYYNDAVEEVPEETDGAAAFVEFEDIEEFAGPISEAEYVVNVR